VIHGNSRGGKENVGFASEVGKADTPVTRRPRRHLRSNGSNRSALEETPQSCIWS
jgi:hypothetical protein